MPIYAEGEVPEKTVSGVRNAAIDCTGVLDSGESLSGTPTVEEVTTSDLTISNSAISTAELVINDKPIASGKAVQFKVSGGAANTTYEIKITMSTDATPAQTIIMRVKLDVVSD